MTDRLGAGLIFAPTSQTSNEARAAKSLLRVTEDHRTILSAALLRDVLSRRRTSVRSLAALKSPAAPAWPRGIFQEELRQVTYLLVGVDNLHDLFDRIRSFQVLRAADLHLHQDSLQPHIQGCGSCCIFETGA